MTTIASKINRRQYWEIPRPWLGWFEVIFGDNRQSAYFLLLLLKLYLFTLTPSAIADFQGGRDNKKKTMYINTNKDSKTQVRC